MAAENSDIAVRMLVSTGRTEDSQFFDYRPSYFGDIIRIEWELDTMDALISAEHAEFLIRRGYAKRIHDEAPKEKALVVEVIEPPSVPPATEPPPVVSSTDATPPEPSPPVSKPQTIEQPPAAKESQPQGGRRSKKEKTK